MRLFCACILGTCLILANFMGPYYRDLILFSKVENTSTPEIVEDCRRFLDPNIADIHFPTKKETLDLFKIEEKTLFISVTGKTLEAKVLIFKTEKEGAPKTNTCLRIGGSDETIAGSAVRVMPYLTAFTEMQGENNLCLIQMSYHDITEGGKPWKPAKIKEVGEATFSLIHALKAQEVVPSVDAMICHSMGGIALEYLRDIKDPEDVPPVLILDRAIPSVWKVGLKHYSYPVTALMHSGAHLLGWSANCEQALVSFFERIKDTPVIEGRKVVVIEAEEDYYFSNKSAFEKNLAERLTERGVEAFQHRFFVNRLYCHERAHHALPIHYLSNRSAEPIGTEHFTVYPYENVAHALVRSFFL